MKTLERIIKSYCQFCKYAGIVGASMFAAIIIDSGTMDGTLLGGIVVGLILTTISIIVLKTTSNNKVQNK